MSEEQVIKLTDFASHEQIKSAFEKYGWMCLRRDSSHIYSKMTMDEYMVYVVLPAVYSGRCAELSVALVLFHTKGIDIQEFGVSTPKEKIEWFKKHYQVFVDNISGFDPEEVKIDPITRRMIMIMS